MRLPSRPASFSKPIGPKIFLAGPLLDGPKPGPTFRLTIRTPEDAVRAVDSLAGRVHFLKTHNAILPEAFFALVRRARAASRWPRPYPSAWGRAGLMPKLIDLVGRLHRAGVPLLAGSDLDGIPAGRAPETGLRVKWNCSKPRDCQRPRPAKPPAPTRSSGGSGNAEHAPQ